MLLLCTTASNVHLMSGRPQSRPDARLVVDDETRCGPHSAHPKSRHCETTKTSVSQKAWDMRTRSAAFVRVFFRWLWRWMHDKGRDTQTQTRTTKYTLSQRRNGNTKAWDGCKTIRRWSISRSSCNGASRLQG